MNWWEADIRDVRPAPAKRRERLITVCDACLRAGCWHGISFCEDYQTAGTVQKTARELRKLDLEHPDYYSRKEVEKACGGTDWKP